ncbi:MAG: hypothetical protein PHU85_03315 [Phycisphaerae bacterium]|nr:hypothetical protein [Phycisphaerae bacterium]
MLRRIVLLALLAFIAYVAGKDLVHGLRQVNWGDLHFNVLAIMAGLALIAAHEFLCGLTLRLSIRSFGEDATLRSCVAAYWSSGLGKYVPGKVATVAGAVAVLARFGLRPATALFATFLHTGVHVLVGLIIALPPLLARSAGHTTALAWALRVACVAGGLACLHPRVFLALGNFALVRMKREPIRTRPRNRFLLATLIVVAFRFAVLGTGIWLVARAVVPTVTLHDWPIVTSTAVGATVIGFLVFFAPAGIGVREDIYFRVLGPVVGVASSSLIAVLTRVAQTVVELGLGVVGLAMLRWAPGTADAKAEVDPTAEG